MVQALIRGVFGKHTKTEPFLHVAREDPVPFKFQRFCIGFLTYGREAHPNCGHRTERPFNEKVYIIARIEVAEIDFSVFDHKPPAFLGGRKVPGTETVSYNGGSEVFLYRGCAACPT